jgi:hypothetical protein
MITKLIQRGTFGAHGRGLDWTGPFLAKRDSQAASSRAVMSVDPSKSGLFEFLMLATSEHPRCILLCGYLNRPCDAYNVQYQCPHAKHRLARPMCMNSGR